MSRVQLLAPNQRAILDINGTLNINIHAQTEFLTFVYSEKPNSGEDRGI